MEALSEALQRQEKELLQQQKQWRAQELELAAKYERERKQRRKLHNQVCD